MYHFTKFRLTLLIVIAFTTSCDDQNDAKPTPPGKLTLDDWTELTHGKTDPDYTTVFPQDAVNTITIRISKSAWSDVNKDMEANTGSKFGGSRPGNGGRQDVEFGQDPKYVAVAFEFNSKQWYKVGYRLKGNSTLMTAWQMGIYKLPFRLKFDEFEHTWTEIKDQRFYGFQELSFAPAVYDNSFIREKLAADLFRQSGVPAARTSFYKVFVDFGEGTKYCGLYTLVEVIDDTMVKTEFGSDDGNIYKPMASFQFFDEAIFEKRNNQVLEDYSDVRAVISALYDPIRLSDPAAWRALLEENFDADHFLKWLAVNTAIENWDTYGMSAHNFYLYNRPGKGLTWIPWDHNMVLAGDWLQMDFSHETTPEFWPLIRFLLDDSVYKLKYREHVAAMAAGPFSVNSMNAMIDKYHNMVAPFIVGPENVESGQYTHLTDASFFHASVDELKAQVTTRHDDIAAFLK